MKIKTILSYNPVGKKAVLHYALEVKGLKEENLQWYSAGAGLNFSIGGFEMEFHRHSTKYVVDYYLPSGMFVVTSWV